MKVLFTGKQHRMRRRETIMHPPKNVNFITLQPLAEMKKDHQLTNIKSSLNDKICRYFSFIQNNNLIKKERLKKIDLIYSPGHLVLNRFPFVIEIDNVSAITYYNLTILKLLKKYIKQKLKSKYCKSIICISEAAKKSVINYFQDKEIEKKCKIVYPYSNYLDVIKKKNKDVTFLFISSNFYLKGGKEVFNAFCELNIRYKDTKLIIITKIKDINGAFLKKIKDNKNIELVEANLDKKDLFQKYYSNADVFVLPTYQDSFGLVYLEAISAGLPIIATKVFAIPEMVVEGENGFLCKPPFNYFNEDFTPCKKWWNKDKVKYIKTHDFKNVEIFLREKMTLLARDSRLRDHMSEKSKEIYKTKFSEEKRKKALLSALRGK